MREKEWGELNKCVCVRERKKKPRQKKWKIEKWNMLYSVFVRGCVAIPSSSVCENECILNENMVVAYIYYYTQAMVNFSISWHKNEN